MKKNYIAPQINIVKLYGEQLMVSGSAHATGDVDVTYGGKSEGGMSADVKRDNYSVWNDDWSE